MARKASNKRQEKEKHMAIYMNYNNIPGDVTESGHAKWIELNSFRWGMGRGISSPVGSSAERESTAPSVSEVVVTKENDIATSKLMQEAFSGEGQTVKIDFTRTAKDKQEIYLSIELTNTMISGYSHSSAGDRPGETISLNFTKVQFSTTQMGPEGDEGQPDHVIYDLATAKTS
ncbi:Type VI secretion system tube protein Hcp [Rhodovastum atsumiense]|uniref:Type VI secretion system tube protein Hcp n=1 Tax=Rhodovastum atsumiense TaxID=504468 RepID=A0A5M6IWL8_9PROT|nr:type VI secretion system tube protein Hcp [Rhodovastum atsumiense]KAA5612724.1 type VI secretion system tube protein Hcp [Rhodovastum atsumiense]CAH2602720.1 Type VI secretion system tube protein Hcp [Rhodovastum atsumiense]